MSSQNYLCIQRSQSGCDHDQQPPSPAQMEEMYAAFNAWREKFKDNIVDLGGALKSEGKIVSSEGATDGPFAEAKEIVGGYMVICAGSMDEAIEVASACPGVTMPGSSVEIRPIQTP